MKKKKILYQEISDSIKNNIITGKYELGSYIPTEIELEKIYDVSKITVRKAIEILCDEGYLVKQSGKGTEVISNRPFNILSKASSFTTILERNGNLVNKRVISVIESTGTEDLDFKYEDIVEIKRIFEINGEPTILFKHFISLPKDSDISSLDNNETSLYSFMASLGIQISYIEDSFNAICATEEIKTSLKLSQDFVLERTRKSYDSGGNLLEYSIAFYDSAKQTYIIDYQV